MFLDLNNIGKDGANGESTNVEVGFEIKSTGKIEVKDIMNGEELKSMQITQIPALVEPIIPKVGVTALIGTSDIGKSTLLLQLCCDVVLNDSFLGFKISSGHKSTIYVSTEDDASSISYRLQHLNVDEKMLRSMRFVFNSENLVKTLDDMLKQQRADIIAIDTFADIFPGEMNQNNKVRSFMNEFSNLATKYQCVIIFNHHTGKNTEEKPPNKNNAIGSAGFEGKARVVIELRSDYADTTKRHFCIVKGNYLGSEYKTSSYELDFNPKTGFVNTGKRKEFALLAKPKASKDNPEVNPMNDLVYRLHKKGRSLREIEAVMKRLGHQIGKTKIGELVKSCPPNPNPQQKSGRTDSDE